MAERARQSAKQYPQHEHAGKHTLLKAQQNVVTSRRRLRDAAELKPCGEVGAQRLREYMLDLGSEYEGDRWRAHVSREIGLEEGHGQKIVAGTIDSVSTRTIDRVARKTGIPVSAFLDPEYEV